VRKLVHRPLSNVPLPGILSMNSDASAGVAARIASSDSPLVDGRQSETALAIARGTARYLHALGYCVVSELPLPSGRRADLVALGGDGEIIIIEIKSSVADFRADQKWMDYRRHCDRLFFATHAGVPCDTAQVEGVQPYEAIIATATDRGCDLIVMASHGRSGLSAVVLGSVTNKVLTYTKVPVLVVP